MIINPLTHKQIKIGSNTFKKLLKLGYIYQFNTLPYDVMHEIFNYLTMPHLLILSLCNQQLNQYINKLDDYRYFITNKKTISCGEQYSYIVKNNKLYVFGHNYSKQLGLSVEICYKPTLILNHVHTVSCGSHHTLILTNDNLYGLGSINNIDYKQPQPIDIKNVLSIHCGQHHSLIKTKNHLYGFGRHSCGQLGLGESNVLNDVLMPTMIDFFNNYKIVKIACGAYHNLILTKSLKKSDESHIYGFGHNVYGQLGLKNKLYIYSPQLIPFLNESHIIDIGCGYHHSIIITTHGLYASGSNVNGQLGLQHLMQSHEFILVDIPQPIRVECGQYHNIVLTQKNELYVFGDHYYGQLGIGKKNNNLPQKLNLKLNIKSLACGNTHTIINGLKKDKLIYYVFGTNKYGELGLGKFKNKKYFTPQLLTFND